jgi:hypothetical protein
VIAAGCKMFDKMRRKFDGRFFLKVKSGLDKKNLGESAGPQEILGPEREPYIIMLNF